jgi:hypothetical protein
MWLYKVDLSIDCCLTLSEQYFNLIMYLFYEDYIQPDATSNSPRDMVYLHMYTHDGIKVMWVDTWQWNGHLKNQREKRIQLLGYDKIAWQRPSNDHWFDLLCLTPLSAIFQLYHGDQFKWLKKQKYPERTTDHGQTTGKLYHLRVECTLFCNLQSQVRTNAVLVIGLYELLGN